MKAVRAAEPGGPEALSLVDVPEPIPGADEVLIDVVAAGINRADVQQRRGLYPPPPGAPDYLGLEVSGRVAQAAGPFEVGQEVVALLAGGGYAERVAAPVGQVLAAPVGVSLVEAAALPETAATVYSNLILEAGLSRGETLLVHGGTGGVGTMAIQFARCQGVHVLATVGGAEKVERARRLGAQEVIDYHSEDFAEVLARRGGADVILDVVGAAYLSRNLEALGSGGRLVIIGLQGGARAQVNVGVLVSKRLTVKGTTLRARSREEKATIMRQVHEHIWPLIASGSIAPYVDRTFPLHRARQAHEYFDSGEHMGKILLEVERSIQ